MKLVQWLKTKAKTWRFKQNLLLFVLMLLFGFIVMNHVTSVQADSDTRNLAQLYRQRENRLLDYMTQHDALLAENEALTSQKDQLISSLLESQGYGDLLAELEKIRVLAGFTEVKGAGIILTLDDKPDYTPNDSLESIVHDTDIRHAIDILIEAGAAAFAINGQRLTNASSIKCIGSTIRCNQERLSPPYVITALGDSESLYQAVANDQLFNFRQTKGIDLVVAVKRSDEVIIPAFADPDNIEQYINLLEVSSP